MIARKKKLCSVCLELNFLFSGGKCKRCWELTRYKSINKITDDDLSGLIEDADAIFSKFIRQDAADIHGNASCFTCGSYRRWQEQQAGHFIGRSCYLLRWDIRNVKVQCKGCNEYKSGNLGVYAAKLEWESPGLSGILMDEARIIYKPSREEIRAIIIEYTKKIECLKESQPD